MTAMPSQWALVQPTMWPTSEDKRRVASASAAAATKNATDKQHQMDTTRQNVTVDSVTLPCQLAPSPGWHQHQQQQQQLQQQQQQRMH